MFRATGLCARNSPVTGELPAQRASNAENVSIWWRHHDTTVRFRKCTWFRFTLLSCDYNFVFMRLQSVNLMHFPIFSRLLCWYGGNHMNCPCVGEVILKDMVNYFSFLTLQQQSTTKHNKAQQSTNLMNSFWAGQLLRPILRPFQSFDSSKFRSPDLRLGHAKSQVYLSTLTFHGVGCQ